MLLSICSYKTKWKKDLTRHMLIHKAASEVTTYECSFCSHKTKYKSCLTQHMMLPEVMTYNCPLCPYKAKLKRSLTSHMLTHQDVSKDVKSAQNHEKNIVEGHESEGCLAIKSEELASKEEEDEWVGYTYFVFFFCRKSTNCRNPVGVQDQLEGAVVVSLLYKV
ncbi:hypothetical protein NQ318_022955 [Aromia moschata]|uniref:C2H2-type domain-containing protein n=1 Tax=Aromia moschata TaxID=1265417 RepID=A0AAV8XBY6_9CUCU|nr:hypothetical protein NQ318_022955 [Aromia moschata]